MECKFKKQKNTIRRKLELIDTLWNVNIEMLKHDEIYYELIDTLWNVNVKFLAVVHFAISN